MNMGERIKDLRLKKGATQEEVGKIIDVSKATIMKYEKGLVENLKRSSIEKLAKYFNVKPSYLMCLEDENKIFLTSLPEQIKIPLLGTVKAGYDYLAEENIIGYENIDNVSDIENYYALQITGDSMEPLFSDGDIAIIHKQNDFESGNTCIVRINGDEATVKKVIKTDNGIDLIAMNPYYPKRHFSNEEIEKIPVEIIGKVTEARKRNQFK